GRRLSAQRGGGSAGALAAPLLRARPAHRAHPAREPVARRAPGLVELVARVPDREEPLPLPRSGGRPRAARAPARRRLRHLARSAARTARSLRPARGAELGVP